MRRDLSSCETREKFFRMLFLEGGGRGTRYFTQNACFGGDIFKASAVLFCWKVIVWSHRCNSIAVDSMTNRSREYGDEQQHGALAQNGWAESNQLKSVTINTNINTNLDSLMKRRKSARQAFFIIRCRNSCTGRKAVSSTRSPRGSASTFLSVCFSLSRRSIMMHEMRRSRTRQNDE